MKRIFITLFIVVILLPLKVKANIMCNDGTVSPSCQYCHSGCCSYHGGCASDSSSVNNSSRVYMDDENDYSLIAAIIIMALSLGIPIYASTLGSQDCKRDKYEKRKKELEEKERKKLEEKKETLLNHTINNNDYSMFNNNDELDRRLLNIITSDDLIGLVELKNENIFSLFETIYQNAGFASKLTFDDLVCNLLNRKKIDEFQIRCIEYILKNNYITKYEDIFLLLFEHRHLTIIYYILNNCYNFKYSFNTNSRDIIFRHLLEIDDVKIAERISKKIAFDFQIGLDTLNDNKNQNVRNTYKILSLLYKSNVLSFLYIEKYIDKKIDFSDSDSVLTFVDTIAKVDGLVEENGYYIIFNLIKKPNYELICKILDKYRNIDLNKMLKVAKSKYYGLTPLIYACYRKSGKIVKLLLDYGVDINFADINGNTALEYACLLGYYSIVRTLYENGARLKESKDNKIIENSFTNHDKYFLWKISLINVQKIKELRKKRK